MPVTLPVAPPRRAASPPRIARRILPAAAAMLVAGLLLAAPAHAQSSGAPKQDTSCAQYGAGFQRVPGSNACVRTGVSVRTDAFGGGAPGNAGSQFNATPSGSSTSSAQSADPWKTAR